MAREIDKYERELVTQEVDFLGTKGGYLIAGNCDMTFSDLLCVQLSFESVS